MKPGPRQVPDEDTRERTRILQEYLRATDKASIFVVAVDASHNASYSIVHNGLTCVHMVEFLNGILEVAKVMIRPYLDGDLEPADDQMPEAHQSSKGPH